MTDFITKYLQRLLTIDPYECQDIFKRVIKDNRSTNWWDYIDYDEFYRWWEQHISYDVKEDSIMYPLLMETLNNTLIRIFLTDIDNRFQKD